MVGPLLPLALLWLAALVLLAASVRVQLRAQQAFNASWPAHARFHAATSGLTRIGVSLLAAAAIAHQPLRGVQ